MAAYIVCPSEAEWAVIGPFLEKCQEGAIIISPGIRLAIESEFGMTQGQIDDEAAGQNVDYDYGGECDIMLDVLRVTQHMGVKPVLEECGVTVPEDFDER